MAEPTAETVWRWQCAMHLDAPKAAVSARPLDARKEFSGRWGEATSDSDGIRLLDSLKSGGQQAWPCSFLVDKEAAQGEEVESERKANRETSFSSRRGKRPSNSCLTRNSSSLPSPRGRLASREDFEGFDGEDTFTETAVDALEEPIASTRQPSAIDLSSAALLLSSSKSMLDDGAVLASGRNAAEKKKKKTRSGVSSLALQNSMCASAKRRRSAVVSVLGHIDHGKTTLLRALKILQQNQTPSEDACRLHETVSVKNSKTKKDALAFSTRGETEAGGITQKIGFFKVSPSTRKHREGGSQSNCD